MQGGAAAPPCRWQTQKGLNHVDHHADNHMKRIRYWTFRTRHGLWGIRYFGGKWHPTLDDQDLGPYNTPVQALEELVGGTTDWPACGSPSDCGLPDDLGLWRPH